MHDDASEYVVVPDIGHQWRITGSRFCNEVALQIVVVKRLADALWSRRGGDFTGSQMLIVVVVRCQ